MNISTLDIITFISIAGGIASIIGCICSEAKDRINYPGLPFRYRCFCKNNTKTKGYHVAIIKNGTAGYTKDIAAGFRNRAVAFFRKTEHAFCFHEDEGEPYSDMDEKNKELLNKIEGKYPGLDLIVVTIGTQVTISAVNYFSNEEKYNIAKVRYGIGVKRRVEFLRTLFERSRELKFVFIYNAKAPQDALMVQEIEEIAQEIDDISIDTYSMTDKKFPEELDKPNIVCFGFYHLNDCLTTFLKQAKEAVFIGLSPRDTIAGAIASTENDDYKLGEISVDKILVPKIIGRKHLSEIELIEPEPYFTINIKREEEKGYRFTKKARKQAAETIDFISNYN